MLVLSVYIEHIRTHLGPVCLERDGLIGIVESLVVLVDAGIGGRSVAVENMVCGCQRNGGREVVDAGSKLVG